VRFAAAGTAVVREIRRSRTGTAPPPGRATPRRECVRFLQGFSQGQCASLVNPHQAHCVRENTMSATGFATPRLWVPGDWNAFFGFGTNILVNMLTLTALMRYVLKLPDALVFGTILPATGLMLFLSTLYYAWLAYDLAKRTGRSDVCALPSGISVPHMFIVVFVIMLPIAAKTGDPIKGWEAGLTWVFVQSFVLMAGGFVAPYIRRITPRAALLGALAGVSIAFISLRPALDMYMTPVIGVLCFAILLASWFGGVRYWKGIPAGLVAIAAGSLIAWGSTALGFNFGGMSVAALGASFSSFGFAFPLPVVGHVFSGFEFIAIILVTAIPFGIYDLVEAMDNVESAEAGGDVFPTTRVLTADGVVSLIGCLMGNPFINAVYIGHPGWKAIGGRIGYSAATGAMVLVLSWFGILALLMALIPVVAISPILLYIGMLIGAQAFQETPKSHAPAVILALVPQVAAWGKLQIDSSLAAAGTNAAAVGMDKLGQVGVVYHGLEVLGSGAILVSLILAAIAACIIDRQFARAGGFAVAGAVLTFFGLMHSEAIGMGKMPLVSLSYLAVAAVLYVCARRATAAAPAVSAAHAGAD
jgi:AGZA family xanthine/uracil permease-like MFS transporter